MENKEIDNLVSKVLRETLEEKAEIITRKIYAKEGAFGDGRDNIDVAEPKGKITKADFDRLRKSKKSKTDESEMEEGNEFSNSRCKAICDGEKSFSVDGKHELNYVKNLLQIYKKIINTWTETSVLNNSKIFNRIFFIAGSSTSNKCGKTIYHSDKVFDFTVHYPDDQKFHWVDFNIGHSSHFRETYTFRQINISITDFMIDFNYFYCYLKPISQNLLFEVKK